MWKRIIFDLVLFGAIFYTPWWVVAPLAFTGAFLFPSYFEIFLCGLLVDLLFGTATSASYGALGVLGALALFFLAKLAKRRLRQAY